MMAYSCCPYVEFQNHDIILTLKLDVLQLHHNQQ